jgi:hypothetical protein
MDALTLFGLLAVTAMLIFYALEDRSPWRHTGPSAKEALGRRQSPSLFRPIRSSKDHYGDLRLV